MALVRPQLSAPGVYVQEVPSGVRTIIGVSTSLTVFIGRTQRGPVYQGVEISSYEEFEDIFGGLLAGSPMTYSVQDFFLNGGSQAVIIRAFHSPASSGSTSFSGPGSADEYDVNTARLVFVPDSDGNPSYSGARPHPDLVLKASSPGKWAVYQGDASHFDPKKPGLTFSTSTNPLNISPMVAERYKTPTWDATQDILFNLKITFTDTDGTQDSETFNTVSLNPASGGRYLGTILQQTSKYALLDSPSTATADGITSHNAGVKDSDSLSDADFEPTLEKKLTEVLDRLDVYNIVCAPPDSFDTDAKNWPALYTYLAGKCRDKKATLIVDPPTAWSNASQIHPENFGADIGVSPSTDMAPYCALYYPRVVGSDMLKGGAVHSRPASGIIAGIMARTDATRGVWKAPAGFEAGLANISGLDLKLTDQENGNLNSQGVNCLRSFPTVGPVVWGARTLAGADVLSSDFKYLPVRRLTDYIEQTLLRQTRWAVFEPNDEPLWSQLRLAIGGFMNDLFRQGAFQGSSRDKAYFVKCDATTTTQDDINRGIVNVEVGFAPLKPAEFVVIYIEQIAGQTS
ncbi:phage tail sheath family protein [Corallococcus aberystwythensis]|uniref:Phage tail sheath family protein n=1 Tax=Corallococcus aberystwythensis TaxID=2316722 RepID=A0A3A8QA92_9BACT|nr:phage tail sheath C-terminal domain-containing protein [Corallococcus aberystwythensis]RKH61642.1 phage tail sheath family protein [Corallococcus aberystwythensis]